MLHVPYASRLTCLSSLKYRLHLRLQPSADCFHAHNSWAPAGFFSGVGKLGGLETKVPSGVQGWSPGGGLGTKSPEADKNVKIMHK